MSSTIATPHIKHANIVSFAAEKVNLRREDAKTYRDQVNRLRDKITDFVNDHPDVGLVKMLLSGSLAKGTALKTLNDIDVALYVDAEKAPENETELLRWLSERLREAYPQMDPDQISPGDHAVRISFRGTGLDVDIVPVYYEGDPDDRGYLYSRETGQRVMTSIPLHLKFIRERNYRQTEHFAQLIRLVKWWVKVQKERDSSFRFKSFMVEMILAHLADSGQDMSDYPLALEQLFAFIKKTELENRISFTDYYPASKLPDTTDDTIEVFDPVNPDNNVAKDYSDEDRDVLLNTAEGALDALAFARMATTKGEAVKCWQSVLGPSFRG